MKWKVFVDRWAFSNRTNKRAKRNHKLDAITTCAHQSYEESIKFGWFSRRELTSCAHTGTTHTNDSSPLRSLFKGQGERKRQSEAKPNWNFNYSNDSKLAVNYTPNQKRSHCSSNSRLTLLIDIFARFSKFLFWLKSRRFVSHMRLMCPESQSLVSSTNKPFVMSQSHS